VRDVGSAGKYRRTVLRAGLTEAFVTGIRKRWLSVRQSPMGIPANPTAAHFEVVSMITYKKKMVARFDQEA
jgi:hypothetical protein